MFWRLLLICLLAAMPARANETVVAGLSQAWVSITANFAGSEILVFGAVKRTAPIPEEPPLNVIITITGPSHPVTVRKKDRRLGIWVNTESLEMDTAPAFYAVATTAPLSDALTDAQDQKHYISIGRAIHAQRGTLSADKVNEYVDAIVRIRSENGLYQIRENSVELTEDTLFRTSVALPSNLTEGTYFTRIFLTRGGEVIDTYITSITVSKVGLERWIYNLAHQQPLVYGILSLAIAIAAGWGASAFFRVIRLG
ncbi:TIGR02186 family protein [Thalassovita sp.]|uniref:TIGR02186 family protein n=1 Tax=Thalassovita sp. TaxID=1979401 RepID=UPI0029DE8F39|nr:TIGR02186 family protein [Thalassovita sp.]